MPEETKACVFCAIISGEVKAEIIHETSHLISFLDHRPLFRGHTLLVPKLHVRLLSDLPADRVGEFFLEAQRLERAVETGPHLHMHVIPRNRKDVLRFWLGPRHPYDASHPASVYAAQIRAALPPV